MASDPLLFESNHSFFVCLFIFTNYIEDRKLFAGKRKKKGKILSKILGNINTTHSFQVLKLSGRHFNNKNLISGGHHG